MKRYKFRIGDNTMFLNRDQLELFFKPATKKLIVKVNKQGGLISVDRGSLNPEFANMVQ